MAIEMNADFNVGFMIPQTTGEQLFNRASQREFHGETTGGMIDQAVTEFSESVQGLDSAIRNTDRLLEMLRTNRMLPEFEAALAEALEKERVNGLERVSGETRKVATLEDILVVIRAEFETLRQWTEDTVDATRELQPQIEQGQFVGAVLEADTRFNNTKITLAFGREKTEAFISTACHATILAVEEIWPLGFEFLREEKRPALAPESGAEATPEAGEASADVAEYTVGLYDIYFDPRELTIPANTDVRVSLPNFGEAPHNFTVDALGIGISLEPGEIGEITINAPPGEYEYYCKVPGHKPGGMVGTLIAR